MKKLQLTKEEENILAKFEAGEFEEVPNMRTEMKRYQNIFKENFKKDATVSLRLNSNDLMKIKSKASDSGIPYQTLLSTLIHHYVIGKIRISL